MTETYYKKNSSGEYEPVSQYESNLLDSVAIGSSMLITVQKNCTIRRQCVDADYVALQAAAQHLSDQLAAIMSRSLMSRPTQKKLTQQQQDLFEQLKQSGIAEFWFPSMGQIVDELLNEIVQAAKPAVNIPWVQEAAEQYRAALALALDTNKNEN